MERNELILYGLTNYKKIINMIISELKEVDNSIDEFDIRLILTEALTNAFKHGNNSNINLPIYLRYYFNNSQFIIEVQDSGDGLEDLVINEDITQENILCDRGRGLYLINCIADELELDNNSLIIKINLSNCLSTCY